MDIIHGLENVVHDPKSALTVGSFDGLHLGHQRIFKQMEKSGGRVTVLTFEPHPQTVVKPDQNPPALLTTFEERVPLFAKSGVQYLVVAKFDKKFAQMEPEEFVVDVLVNKIGMADIFVGPTHAFGRGRKGTVEILHRLGEQHNFNIHQVDTVSRLGGVISSSRIRRALLEGDVLTAWRCLGRPFYLSGKVVHGDGRGVKLGFPTANIELSEAGKIAAPPGIYATITDVNGVRWPSVSHIGDRPTFQGASPSTETHIIGFSGNVYGREIHLGLIDRLRDVAAFSSPVDLVRQMIADRQAAKQRLAELGFGRDARMRVQRYGKIVA